MSTYQRTPQCRQADRSRVLPGRLAGRIVVSAFLGAALAMPGFAIAQSPTESGTGWQYEITPYLWAAGMKGSTETARLPKTTVDMGFSDVLDVLDFGAMGTFEARKDRWGFLVDLQYIKVSDAAIASRTGPAGATLTASATAKLRQTMLAGAAFYRVAEGPAPVDVIGGLRAIDLNVDATIDASLYGSAAGVATSVFRSDGKSWTDPYIGVRVQYPIADRWTLVGYLDIGGTGSNSTSYQAVIGANYQYSKTVSGKFGYRYLKMDYDKSGFVYDMKTSGLYAGLGFRF